MAHTFLSYVRENTAVVDRLMRDLTARGVRVWLDREHIMPGQRWREAIRDGIRSGDLFIACFSKAYHTRDSSYMNEELTLAIEELRQRPAHRAWFIPVSLDGSLIPSRAIGAGETIHDLQWVDLSTDWTRGVEMIARAVTLAVGPAALDARLDTTASKSNDIYKPRTLTALAGSTTAARVRYLTVQDVVDLHKAVCAEFGGPRAHPGVIESQFGLVNAVQRPQITTFGRDAYQTFPEKAAALMFALLQAHPFRGGNGRVALASLVVFCELNNRTLDTRVFDEKTAVTLIQLTTTCRERGIPPETAYHELREMLNRSIVKLS